MQGRQPTNTTIFSLFLTKHPPGSTTFNNPLALANDSYHATNLQALQMQLLERIKALQNLVMECLD